MHQPQADAPNGSAKRLKHTISNSTYARALAELKSVHLWEKLFLRFG